MLHKNKFTVLLVDDNQSLLVTIGDLLRDEGFIVFTAETGEDALHVLTSTKPDLIILDINMPGMGGMGFLKRIMHSDGTMPYPVLVLTARANLEDFCSSIQVCGFLSKPCSPRKFLQTVRKIVEPDAPVEPERIQVQDALDTGRPRIVLGESDPSISVRICGWFERQGYLVERHDKGFEALKSIAMEQPDLVVFNEILDDTKGSVVASMLGAIPSTTSIPIVLYAADGRTENPVMATRGGGGVVALVPSDAEEAIGLVVKTVLR